MELSDENTGVRSLAAGVMAVDTRDASVVGAGVVDETAVEALAAMLEPCASLGLVAGLVLVLLPHWSRLLQWGRT